MSTLGQYRATLNRWGLQDNPFRPTPPDDPEKLARIFYGRERELQRAIPALYEGRNVLIRGAWGIGKTALILTILKRLQQEVASLGEEMLLLYLGRVPGDTPTDFYRALLLTVADSLADSLDDREARAIADSIRGLSAQKAKMSAEGKVNLAVFSLGIKRESPSTPALGGDPYSLLIPMLERAQQEFSRLVLAVDDLDKKDIPIVQDILEGSLDLFRMGEKRAFLMTGRGFTDLQEVTLQALGIFSEDITLASMLPEELCRIAINYLNTARKVPQDNAYPFTEEVIDQIAKYAQGTPRQLNVICEKLLRQAAMEGRERIDEAVFSDLWRTIQQQVTYALTPHLRRLLYIAYEAGGISEDIADQYLEQLGVLTFVQLLPMLKPLEEQELLVRKEDKTGYRFLPSKLFLPEGKEFRE